MNDTASAAIASISGAVADEGDTAMKSYVGDEGEDAIKSYIPPYVNASSWQPWNHTDPCPAGFTCSHMGNKSLGAFSCDEMARIALDEFGLGNILAGTYCPEGEEGMMNCPVGGYCPTSETKIDCPAGTFCNYKTYAPTLVGGGNPCSRCPAGSESARLSRTQIVGQAVVFVVVALLVVARITARKAGMNKEKLITKLHLEKVMKADARGPVRAAKLAQEKYARLRPKLEVIADRLGKMERRPQDPRDPGSSSVGSALSKRSTILYIDEAEGVVFHANEFFDALDCNGDGELSYEEINGVLGLGEEQLRAFVSNMREKVTAGHKRMPHETVARSTFVRYFLDALADASQLEPTKEEAGELFDGIAAEIGTNDAGEISYKGLYSSILSSFLSDLQIYGVIGRFKRRGADGSGSKGISRRDFVECYPLFLGAVARPDFVASVRAPGSESRGLDVAFERLSLTVAVGREQVHVVDGVTGRLCSNTMTAVMGGSGSGKSSLLNALCGRAYYGKVEGTVKINGNDSKIEEHKAVIGFVPQEDIVYPDLTVRENLLYSGRLQLPAGTPRDEIGELADATMASLGLSRIANSLVGDARRRGVSGGEKKRVNIGLELMKKPKILFLDEPTSGLDSRSAFVVMDSLKRLVSTQGMTVACVIHQPRTDIYDMFDSLFLLGVGGSTVYHGPATECKRYFEKIGFQMQEGESQADWFLDISSGDVEPSDIEAGGIHGELATRRTSDTVPHSGMGFKVALQVAGKHALGFALEQREQGNFVVKEITNIQYANVSTENSIQVGDKVVGINGRRVGEMTLEDVHALLSKDSEDSTAESYTVFVQLFRQDEGEHSDHGAEDGANAEESLLLEKPSNEDGALVKARLAREKLYHAWDVHFKNLSPPKKAQYFDPPKAFSLPATPRAVPGWSQLLVQLRRNCLLSWRNRDSRLIDCVILLVAILLITMLSGPQPSAFDRDPEGLLWIKFIASAKDASEMLPIVFSYSYSGISKVLSYLMIVGLVVSVLIGLNATKIITDKRLEFFREAQSGVSVSMYYLAATITTTVEQGLTAIAGSAVAYLILTPATSYLVYLWNFFMLSWLSVSWAVLLAIVVPQESVSTVVGFFNAFFGLLFCGQVAPGSYRKLYEIPVLQVISGFFSPLRFFVEEIAVSEAKCLPGQSGFTVGPDDASKYPTFYKQYPYWNGLTYMAHTDLSSATVSSCSGWFWWVGAAFAVGITIRIVGGIAIHFSRRAQQGKKSFRSEVVADFHEFRAGTASIFQSFILNGILVFIVFAGFFTLSCWLILKVHPGNDQFS